MALSDKEHPSCPCPPDGIEYDCTLHGVGTSAWALMLLRQKVNTSRVPPQPRLGESIRRHTDKLILQQKQDINDCRELLIESRNHAKLTQNLGLLRRIDRKLEDLGVIE